MTDKVLSVSIAAYNVEDTLEEVVKSVLLPEVENNIEVIIVNDGSTDDTILVADKLKKKHPKSIVVIDKENGGYGSTINASIAVARGKYYKLLDGDDWFNCEALPSFIQYLKKSETDVVITPYTLVKDNEETVDSHTEITSEAISLGSIVLNNYDFHMAEITIKTEVYRNLNHQISEHAFYTDVEFIFYTIVSAKTISRYEKAIYRYRIGDEGQSISINGYRKHYKDQVTVLKAICNCYKDNEGIISGNKKEMLDCVIVNTIRTAFLVHMLLEKPNKNRKELLSIDRYLKKEHNNLYELSNKSRLVHILRVCKFMPYRVWSLYITNKFRKNGFAL